MNYNELEAIARSAARKTLGSKMENFDRGLVTANPNEGITMEGFNLRTTVELSFTPSVFPFDFFSSDVVFFVNLLTESPRGISHANVQAFFGNYCTDVEAAEKAATAFLQRDVSDGWYVADCLDCDFGLHLRYELGGEFESDDAFAAAVERAFAELCGSAVADQLRSFVCYFEDFCHKIPENLSFDRFQSMLLRSITDALYDNSDCFKVSLTSDDYRQEYTVVDEYTIPTCLMGNHTPSFEDGFTLDAAVQSALLPAGCTKMFVSFKAEGSVMTVTARFGSKHALSEKDDSMVFVKPWDIRIDDSLNGKLVLKSRFVVHGEAKLRDTLKELMDSFNSDKLYSYLACKGKVISAMKKHFNTNNH